MKIYITLAKYDDASWHYGGEYPAELPQENGATHIGFFLTWCIENNLISDFQLEESSEDVKRVLNREITGREFLLTNCDEKFTDEDLNDLGNDFAKDYYDGESEFSKSHPSYLTDYEKVVGFFSQEMGIELKSFYHVDNSWEFYEGIKALLDERFLQWKTYKGIR